MAVSSPVPNAPSLPAYVFYKTIGFLAFSILLGPVLLLRFVRHFAPGQRPYPTWSLHRDLALGGGRLYLACTERFCLPRPEGKKAWQADKLVHKIVGKGTEVTPVKIPPAQSKHLIGTLAVANDIVKPENVPGFWTYETSAGFTKGDDPARPGEKVLLYIAGGSWIMGHPMGTPFPYRFCTSAHRRVLSVNHRKTLTPDSAFPAPLQDALAAYLYVLALGFQPENVIFIGDSSGAHVWLALSRYLAELGKTKELGVGMPGVLMLVSPSTNLSHPPPPSKPTDFLVPYLNRRAYPSLSRHYPADALSKDPYFSPAVAGTFAYLADAQAQPRGLRIFVQHGTVELLTPDQELFVKKLRDEGVQVEVDVIEGGCHLDPGIAFALGERAPSSSWIRLLEAVARFAK